MAVQVGTVDGLINITPVIKDCFVKAIDSFSVNVIKNNNLGDLSIGDAFQRYTYPVYSGQETDFKLESLTKEVTTKTGNKQSPAYVTYCKKMGLLETEGSDFFELTPVGTALKDGQIELHEYAMLYMSKQGIFIDGKYKGNLLEHIANIFKVSSSITTDELLQSIATKYGDSNFQKTRSDIILGALCAAKILSKLNNVYVLAGIAQAQVLNIFAKNGKSIRPAVLDTDQAYADYVGTFKYGLYDFLNEKNVSLFADLYPNLMDHLQENYNHGFSSLPLQQIFYGAPGTGKSHTIEKCTGNQPKENVFRTTFHPDSDYSTFVGSYKPSMKPATAKQAILDYDGLVDKFKEYLSADNNITRACTKFGFDFHDSIVKMQEDSAHTIPLLVADAYKSGTTYDTQVRAGMSVYETSYNEDNVDDKIVYSYVPQTFTKAYIRAWQTTDPVFLIIEEINRGNCAQIFGDLFQLLDRKNSVSEYPIKPDTDLGKYIYDTFVKEGCIAPQDSHIFKGNELKLPANLYIWATMNTSDQSLFPIDSAFKRRWDWRYIKIAQPKKDGTDEKFHWKIEGDIDWWQFVKKINDIILRMTNSADKQLGYFFAKANNVDVITYDCFVSKVCFYLWNDIFKTYAVDGMENSLFKYTYIDEDDFTEKTGVLDFTKFFDDEGKVVPAIVQQFIENVMNWQSEAK